LILLAQSGQLGRRDENFRIQLVAALDCFDHLRHIQVVVAPAKLLQGFARLEGATAAPADVVALKERPLRARMALEHLGHRALRSEEILFRSHWYSNAKELLNVANDLHETVNFRGGVVEIKAGPRGGLDPEL